jgi:hypothetical protein
MLRAVRRCEAAMAAVRPSGFELRTRRERNLEIYKTREMPEHSTSKGTEKTTKKEAKGRAQRDGQVQSPPRSQPWPIVTNLHVSGQSGQLRGVSLPDRPVEVARGAKRSEAVVGDNAKGLVAVGECGGILFLSHERKSSAKPQVYMLLSFPSPLCVSRRRIRASMWSVPIRSQRPPYLLLVQVLV